MQHTLVTTKELRGRLLGLLLYGLVTKILHLYLSLGVACFRIAAVVAGGAPKNGKRV